MTEPIRSLRCGWNQGLLHSLSGVAMEKQTRGQWLKSWDGRVTYWGQSLMIAQGSCGAQIRNMPGVRVGRGGVTCPAGARATLWNSYGTLEWRQNGSGVQFFQGPHLEGKCGMAVT